MTLTQLGGSLVAVLVLAWIARWLRLGESRITDPTTAAEFAESSLAGFRAGRAVVGTDGAAALVAGDTGIAVVKRHGAKVAVRRLIPPLHLRVSVEGVTVETGERLFGAVTLFGVTEIEVRALEAEAGRTTVVTLH
ncbi:hypothetical protein ASE86_01940 [Sphingomonas sp. Leaf33]|uniref:hypothetical protein n=1 Tax=Sphingomonas sp. Leaf33 TaxID=1736215 RepID=UPI0006FF5B41|nr:hypothetical protein [Sphingomonas sp. Leaf33]KQN25052.1 hypothetical protein ASE86_01940 [Sphingomonas sp. Leaf33]